MLCVYRKKDALKMPLSIKNFVVYIGVLGLHALKFISGKHQCSFFVIYLIVGILILPNLSQCDWRSTDLSTMDSNRDMASIRSFSAIINNMSRFKDAVVIDNYTVIENRTIIFNRSIEIAENATLIIRNSYISFSNEMRFPYIRVAGLLILVGSVLYAPTLFIYSPLEKQNSNITVYFENSNVTIWFLSLSCQMPLYVPYNFVMDNSSVWADNIFLNLINNTVIEFSYLYVNRFYVRSNHTNIFACRFQHNELCTIDIASQNGEFVNCTVFNGYVKLGGNVYTSNVIVNGKELLYMHDVSNKALFCGSYGGVLVINVSNIKISGLSAGYIFLSKVQNLVVENCSIDSFGIYVYKCQNVVIRNNSISCWNVTDPHEELDLCYTGVTVDLCTNVTIERNIIARCSRGIYFAEYACPCYSSNVIVRNNIIESCWVGMRWTSLNQNYIADGNIFTMCNIGVEIVRNFTGRNIIEKCNIGCVLYGHAIRNSIIRRNNIGVLINWWSSSAIEYTDITENRIGIMVDVAWLEEYCMHPYPILHLTINYNNIYSNLEHGLFINTSDRIRVNVDARYNWWGSPSGPEISSSADSNDPEEIWYVGNVSLLIQPWSTFKFVITFQKRTLGVGFIVIASLIFACIAIVLKKKRYEEHSGR